MVEHAAESFFRVVWRARDFAVEGVHLSGEETFVSTGADPLHYRGTDGRPLARSTTCRQFHSHCIDYGSRAVSGKSSRPWAASGEIYRVNSHHPKVASCQCAPLADLDDHSGFYENPRRTGARLLAPTWEGRANN